MAAIADDGAEAQTIVETDYTAAVPSLEADVQSPTRVATQDERPTDIEVDYQHPDQDDDEDVDMDEMQVIRSDTTVIDTESLLDDFFATPGE